MREVEIRLAEPGWEVEHPAGEFIHSGLEPREKGIREPALFPFEGYTPRVEGQGTFMPSPHPGSGVILPPVLRFCEGKEDLFRLDSLLPEPGIVEHAGRTVEIRVREKCLHYAVLMMWSVFVS